MVIKSLFKKGIFLILATLVLNNCGGPSLNANQVYSDCMIQYENLIKVDSCAKESMRNFESQYGSGTVYGRGSDDLQFLNGLIFKVKNQEISNNVALNRYQQYHEQKRAKARATAGAWEDFFRDMNCALYQTDCR